MEWVVGLRPTWGGLAIDPRPWAALGTVEAKRVWRGVPVTVRFDARAYVAHAPVSLTLNGTEIEGNVIRPEMVQGEPELHVEVSWGAKVRTGYDATQAGQRSRT
jgi:hypothetical protein